MRSIILVLLVLNLFGCATAPWVSVRPIVRTGHEIEDCEKAAEDAGQGFWANKDRFVEKCMYSKGFVRSQG